MTVLPRRSFSAISFPFSSCKVKSGALSLTFMQISPKKGTLRRGNATREAFPRPTIERILHCGILACSVGLITVLGAFLNVAAAQEERPQITPGERRPAKKKDSGPRAVAVLQMSANGKSSLVPIAILINGKFWDASAYKADPVPMALDSGTVYEAEQTGSSLGLFTINGALHSNAANSQAPWIGIGAWHANGSEEPKKELQAEKVPVGIEIEDQPPRLSHTDTKTDAGPGSGMPNGASPPTSASKQPPSSPKPDSQKSEGGSNSGGDEPPRLSKPSSPSPPPTSGSGNPSGAGTSEKTHGDSKAKDAKSDQANVPASDSGAGQSGRPRLRRGKPEESFADEDVPGYSKPGASPSASSANSGQLAANPAKQGDTKLIPAISDASGPPPHSYAFEWLKGEEGDRRKQMTDLAKEQVRNYLAAQQRNKISATPTPRSPARMQKRVEPVLENVQMIAYDLWNSNQPVIVLSAEAHMPPPTQGTAHSEVQSELQYSVLLVAYPDIYNNLRKLYAGVTDKFHLDVTPRLELVDVVDADGDGRGELLFRKTSDLGTGWVIYRATADKLWKMYDSLSPL